MVLYQILGALSLCALAVYGFGVFTTWRFFKHPPPPPLEIAPAVSVLKPIKGLEEELKENLQSFFDQVYPGPWEIVFSSNDPDDPGIIVAKQVARDYPEIPCRFIQSDTSFGRNPKVCDLAGAYFAAHHDLVLQTDANVRVPKTFLSKVVSEFESQGISLLSCPVVGAEEQAWGAAVENTHLCTFITPSVCFTKLMTGITCVIGKAMLLRRSELEELGGLAMFKDKLCEDYLLGDCYRKNGRVVELSRQPITNINIQLPLKHFFSRHSRWLKMQAVIHPPSFVLALLWGNPGALAFAAWILSCASVSMTVLLLGVIAAKAAGDILLFSLLATNRLAWLIFGSYP
ncbi:MAG: glycosyltransferase [Myxococcales bacterium]|nr:MAG: glycosyltransferase [Myxococcales bacterium]